MMNFLGGAYQVSLKGFVKQFSGPARIGYKHAPKSKGVVGFHGPSEFSEDIK